MKLVELYGKVRYAVQMEGISRREAARRFGIDPRTVAKMLSFSVPPGYRPNQAGLRDVTLRSGSYAACGDRSGLTAAIRRTITP
jgi:hypothetical protein